MQPELETFPHLGEHCDNDSLQIRVIFWLLAIFAVAIALGLVAGLRAI